MGIVLVHWDASFVAVGVEVLEADEAGLRLLGGGDDVALQRQEVSRPTMIGQSQALVDDCRALACSPGRFGVP